MNGKRQEITGGWNQQLNQRHDSKLNQQSKRNRLVNSTKTPLRFPKLRQNEAKSTEQAKHY